jgi:hypothetical protein
MVKRQPDFLIRDSLKDTTLPNAHLYSQKPNTCFAIIQNDVPKGSLKYFYGPAHDLDSSGGFSTVIATDKEFAVTYYDAKGKELYSATSHK